MCGLAFICRQKTPTNESEQEVSDDNEDDWTYHNEKNGGHKKSKKEKILISNSPRRGGNSRAPGKSMKHTREPDESTASSVAQLSLSKVCATIPSEMNNGSHSLLLSAILRACPFVWGHEYSLYFLMNNCSCLFLIYSAAIFATTQCSFLFFSANRAQASVVYSDVWSCVWEDWSFMHQVSRQSCFVPGPNVWSELLKIIIEHLTMVAKRSYHEIHLIFFHIPSVLGASWSCKRQIDCRNLGRLREAGGWGWG